MKSVFLALALLLAAGALAYAEDGQMLPSSSVSGRSLGVDKYVPALEARAQYITCRVDHQITVLGGLYVLSEDSAGLQGAIAGLEAAKSGLLESASNGNLSGFNAYVRGKVEPEMRASANLSKATRKEMARANQTNASSIASVYKSARETRLECEKAAREHARDLAKMALQERVNASRQRIDAARGKLKERVQAAKDNLKRLRELMRARLNNSRVVGNASRNGLGLEVFGRNGSEHENGTGDGNSAGRDRN